VPGSDGLIVWVAGRVDRIHDVETDAERDRLRALVDRLTDKDLIRRMPGDWTVASVLAHIGFWDAKAIYYLDKWAAGAPPTPYEPENTDAINDSAKPLCLALLPRDAAKLSLRLAEEADRKVKALSDEMLRKIQATGGPPFNLSRAIHRKEHLDQIESMFSAQR
jgi:DinB family protein